MSGRAEPKPCECGWPAKDCIEECELVSDCPRFVQAQEAFEVDESEGSCSGVSG